jgi:GT2 family glycosyltransferase
VELSILIVNWNTKDLLRDCLQSIYSSAKNIAFEVIVVDNNSYDKSFEMVRDEFPEAILIQNRENAGFAKGNNQAYSASRGRVVALLNPDTVVYPNSFEKMIDYLDRQSAVGAVSCKFISPDGSFQFEFFRRFPTIRSIFFRYTNLGKSVDLNFYRGKALDRFFYKDRAFSETETIEQPGAVCLLMRRALLERIGLFDEQLPIFFNDVDLCKRIWNEGYSIHVLSDTHITHLGGSSFANRPRRELVEDWHHGMVYYFRKHHGFARASLIFLMVFLDRWIHRIVRLLGINKVATFVKRKIARS